MTIETGEQELITKKPEIFDRPPAIPKSLPSLYANSSKTPTARSTSARYGHRPKRPLKVLLERLAQTKTS
jgi:hypothetical protein